MENRAYGAYFFSLPCPSAYCIGAGIVFRVWEDVLDQFRKADTKCTTAGLGLWGRYKVATGCDSHLCAW